MKKIITAGLICISSGASIAQNGTLAESHRPNGYTLACLESPTRDCVFSSAIQTVIAEEFGVERAKVLIAVARALIETDQRAQAIETLMLALEEARSVNLSLVTQEKITEIAPLLARADDAASALALTDEIQISSVKDRTLIAIAKESMLAGRIADANVALDQVNSENRSGWQRLRMLPFAPVSAIGTLDMDALDAQVRAYGTPSQVYRGLVLLAVLSERRSQPELRQAYLAEADTLFSSLVAINDRALAVAHRLRIMYDGGISESFLRESYALAVLHTERVRSDETMESIGQLIGVVESDLGNLESALLRLEVYKELPEKARYLSTLNESSQGGRVAQATLVLLNEVAEIEGVYERDLIRLQLLEGALSNKDLVLAEQVIRSLEDDDNQARGLVLAASLLE